MKSKVLAPAVVEYEFPAQLAKNIIEIIEQSNSIPWEKSGVGTDSNQDQEIRTSNGFSFSETFPFWAEEIKKYFVEAIKDYTANYPESNVTQDEGFNLLRYEGAGKYDFHSDSGWTIYRTVSALIYLNPSEYEGGETFFKHFDVKVKPENPSVVVFPSNYAYLHAALPVTEGRKYVIVTWMNDLPEGFHPAIMYNVSKSVGR